MQMGPSTPELPIMASCRLGTTSDLGRPGMRQVCSVKVSRRWLSPRSSKHKLRRRLLLLFQRRRPKQRPTGTLRSPPSVVFPKEAPRQTCHETMRRRRERYCQLDGFFVESPCASRTGQGRRSNYPGTGRYGRMHRNRVPRSIAQNQRSVSPELAICLWARQPQDPPH